MKILLINSVYKYSSTGGIVYDLEQQIINNRFECFIAYGQGKTHKNNTFKIGGTIENHLHNLGSRIFGKQGYFTSKGTHQLIEYIEYLKPDIIHLHNIHGHYLNFPLLFNYLAKKNFPIVWTLHDCWAFTGKCAYYTSANCHKWEQGCYSCPLIHTYPPSIFFDKSKQMYRDKKLLFNQIKNMTLVPVSKWLESEVSRSFLNKYPTEQIYNWIDRRIFHPYSENIHGKYAIPKNRKYILSVSAGWDKNTSRYKDAISLAEKLDCDKQLILVGATVRGTRIPKNIVHIPYVDNAIELAKIYSSADVYVHLSVQDTFGKVIAESLACGTPVIVYNSTACPEVVGSSSCGYIVEPHDIEAIKEKIDLILDKGKDKFTQNCIDMVKNNYDYNINVPKFIELYKNIISVH